MKKLTVALSTSALTVALVLSGCTSGTAPSTTAPEGATPPSVSVSTASAADEMFVTMMIPHHQQAIDMAEIVLSKDGIDPRVTELAQQVKDAQGPEIERMLGWLEGWGVEYDPDATGGMDHGSMNTDDGMMSDKDMIALENADATEGNRLFLEQMIVHHEGAVDMARTALEDAQDPDVLALAQQVIDDQNAEIGTMQDLLTDL